MEKKQNITFGALLLKMPEEVTESNPSPKSLRENDTPLLVSTDGRAIAYESGYVYYRAVSREVVLNIHECWKFVYEGGKWLCPKNVRKEDVLAMDWYTVISVKGEEQAALNLENLENDHKYRENIQEAVSPHGSVNHLPMIKNNNSSSSKQEGCSHIYIYNRGDFDGTFFRIVPFKG